MVVRGRLVRDRFVLVITGGPGVGKHTTARLVAKKFRGSKTIDINRMLIANNAISNERDDKFGSGIDVKKARRLIDFETKISRYNFILFGHLAPYVVNPHKISMAIVLRRSPYELISVYRKRHYSPEKTRENLASEILGITLYDSLKSFGKAKLAEIDTTGETASQTVDKIVSLLQGSSKARLGYIDWLSLIEKNHDVQTFLEY
jgi:adenylate kinase